MAFLHNKGIAIIARIVICRPKNGFSSLHVMFFEIHLMLRLYLMRLTYYVLHLPEAV